jgi:glycoside/pentoside/hexuronide:cation symporter, GPH family
MRLGHKLTYAAPAIGIAGISFPLLIYLPPYYASHVGLPLGAIGFAFLLIRLLDIGFDVIAGYAMDRFTCRWGRFRPWLVLGAALMTIAIAFLFMPPAGVGMAYLIVFLALTYIGYSICTVAQLGWGCTISNDQTDRNSVFAYWQAASLVGTLIVTAIPLLPSNQSSAGAALSMIAWFLLAAIPLGTLAAMIWAPEYPRPAARRPSFGDYLRLLAKPVIARLLLTDLLIGMAVFNGGALFFFYMITRHGIGIASGAMLFFVINLGALVGAYLWAGLGDRLGKANAASLGFICYAIGLVAYHFMPLGNPVGAAIFLFLFGVTLTANPVLVRSMLADAGDQIQELDGVDHTGLIAALFTNCSKLGAALGPPISFLLLDWASFDATSGTQNATAVTTLYVLAIWAPLAIALFCAWFIRSHCVGRERLTVEATA